MRYWIICCCLVWVFATPASAQPLCGSAGTRPADFTLPDVGQTTLHQSNITAALQAYFDDGGGVPALLLAVQSQLVIDNKAWSIAVFKGNVVGTTDDDWVIDLKVYFGEREDNFLHGMIFTLTCDENDYAVLEVTDYQGHRGGGFLGAEAGVLAVREMTGDAQAEIIMNIISNIGMHFYTTREYLILGWDGTAFARLIPYYEENRAENIYQGYSAARTFNAAYELMDTNGDGIPELVLTSPQFKHHNMFAWSRLARGDKDTWRWNGAAFEVCSLAATPPEYRIQAIEDGSRAFMCGSYNLAIIGYEQALNDESLLPWSEADNLCTGCDLDNPDTAVTLNLFVEELQAEGIEIPDPAERERLNAYAHYRLVLVYAAVPDALSLANHLEALQTDYADSPYAALADIFYDNFESNNGLARACAAVKEYAAENAVFSPFINYSYSGTEMTIPDEITGGYPELDDLCPFGNLSS